MIANNKTTTRLQLPSPRAWWNVPAPLSLAICVVCTAGIIAAVGQIATQPRELPPIIIVATAPAVVVPTAVPIAQPAAYQPAPAAAPVRQVVAFAAPGGDVLGPVPMPAASAITGRWGDEWVSTDHEGATVWIRVSELGANLANLAPQAPQLQPAYQQAPAPAYQPEPQYQTSNQPEAPQQPAEQPAAAPMVAAPVPQAQPTEAPKAGIFFQQTPTQIELQRLAYCYEHPEFRCAP